jgi:magnesium transporter
VIGGLQRGESTMFQEATIIYLRDVYEHTIQVIDTVETHRDIVSGLLDIYLSGLSYKMNEVMRVLTVIATIFIPLTFITGLYGMNFQHMPELHYRWAYPLVLLLMLFLSGLMLAYFRRRGWL